VVDEAENFTAGIKLHVSLREGVGIQLQVQFWKQSCGLTITLIIMPGQLHALNDALD